MGQNFELKIDHSGLQHIFSQRNLNARQRHWSKLLNEYEFYIAYVKGNLNRVSNELNQRR